MVVTVALMTVVPVVLTVIETVILTRVVIGQQ